MGVVPLDLLTICILNCPISAVLVFFATMFWCIAEPKCAAASGCLAGGGSGDVASSFRSELSAATPVELRRRRNAWTEGPSVSGGSVGSGK